MSELEILRFDRNGPPTGFEPMGEFTAEALAEGSPTPVESGFNYFTSPDGRLTAGVWECTPVVAKFGPYPVDEFMLVLDGAITVGYADGEEDTFRAGDAFLIPKGLPIAWKQSETVRKFYMIYDSPTAGRSHAKGARAIRLQPQGPAGVGLQPMELPDTSVFGGELPTQTEHTYYEDESGQFTAGVWTCTPMRRKAYPFPRFEMMCLLEGSVSLTDDRGTSHKFQAPEVLLVPQGQVNAWHSSEDVRKYYCIYQPAGS